jgi:membrane dipeptidase
MRLLAEADERRAEEIHRKAIIFDGMLGGPKLNTYRNFKWSEESFDEMVRGGITGGNLCITVHDNLEMAVKKFGDWYLRFDKYSDRILLATSVDDFRRAKMAGRLAFVLGFQNSKQIDRDASLLQVLYRLGLRVLQITYNERNRVGDGCLEPKDAGLSAFGERLVKELNRLGIVIDLSHVGPRTSIEAIELSANPCIFSHSSADSVCKNKRNITDRQIEAVATKGGVVGVCSFPTFLTWEKKPSLEHLLDHIDYVVRLVGVDHVGIGTDMFTGKTINEFVNYDYDLTVYPDWPWPVPVDFEDMTKWPNLTRGLIIRGYSDEDILKILGGNFLRVLDTVTKPVGRARTN